MLVERLLARQSRFNRCRVRGVTETISPRWGAHAVEKDGERRHQYEFVISRDGDMLDLSGSARDLNRKTPRVDKFRHTCNGKARVSYRYLPAVRDGPTGGRVWKRDRNRERLDFANSAHFGFALDGCLRMTDGKYAASLLLESQNLHVVEEERVGDVPCTVVEGTTPYGTIRLWIDESRGCSVLKAVLDQGPDHQVYFGQTLSEMDQAGQLVPDGYAAVVRHLGVLDNVTLSEVDGDYVTVGGRFTDTLRLSDDTEVTNVYICERTEVDYNPDLAGSDAFVSDLPSGSGVTFMDDPDSGVQYVWQDGDIVVGFVDFSPAAEGMPESGPWLARAVAGSLGILFLLGISLWVYFRSARRNKV